MYSISFPNDCESSLLDCRMLHLEENGEQCSPRLWRHPERFNACISLYIRCLYSAIIFHLATLLPFTLLLSVTPYLTCVLGVATTAVLLLCCLLYLNTQ